MKRWNRSDHASPQSDTTIGLSNPPMTKPRLRRILDHVWGPVGSAILHAVLLMLIIHLAFRPPPSEPIPTGPVQTSREPLPLDPPPSRIREPLPTPPDPIPSMDPIAPPGDLEPDHPEPEPIIDAGLEMETMGPVVISGLLIGRDPEAREKAKRRFNPDLGPQTDVVIWKALEWLRDHQQSEGFWGTGEGNGGHRVGMTGIALLAFLAAGETPNSHVFGTTVERAIRWLMAQQRADGSFLEVGRDHAAVYENAMAAYAMSEAFALTRVTELRGVMERGIAFILTGQQDSGAFTYAYEKNGRRDTSVTGWQVQAMKAAQIAGAEVAGLDRAMEAAARGLAMNFRPDSGRFSYAPDASGPGKTTLTCTGIGLLSLEMLGHAGDPELDGGFRALRDLRVNWRQPDAVGDWPIYGWYYITQAKFHRSPEEWESWRRPFFSVMIGAQNADGSWTPVAANERTHGRVYGTAFTALSLMVHIRTLPTYGKIHGQMPAPRRAADAEDVVVNLDT